ncbi:lipid-A-disaccharide synthase [candidate division WOR-3 bacterium]|nr:lipid-A-disaccharide synthase [candidate division WOR-3 bacterium]
MVKFFVITGEASGDLHASFLIKEIKKRLPESRFFGIGGKKMEDEGVKLFFHIEKISVVGFWEAFMKVGNIRKILRSIVEKMRNMKPDALILVDFPGFNLRLAPFAKNLGIKVIYYITPQVWAWGGWRLRSMYKNIDLALVIFPFEERIFSSYGIKTSFVGHPILDEMSLKKSKELFCKEHALSPEKPIIALLPGSREGEIKRILPIMLLISKEIKKRRSDVQFILPTISEEMEGFLPDKRDIRIIYDETSDGIHVADTALAASGTVTLETAFLGTPSVIIYKISILTYLIIKWLIKLPYIGLVNIVRGKKIIPEYIQFSIRINQISDEILRMLEDTRYVATIKEELKEVKKILGKKGASKNAAEIIVKEIMKKCE